MPSVKNLAKLLCVLEKRSNLQKSYLKQKSFVRNLYGKRYGRSPAVIRIPYYCGALGRDEATRTPDPYVPNVVRYQLRYIPIFRFFLTITSSGFACHRSFAGANSRLPRSPSSFSTKINFKKFFCRRGISASLSSSVICRSTLPSSSLTLLVLDKNKLQFFCLSEKEAAPGSVSFFPAIRKPLKGCFLYESLLM